MNWPEAFAVVGVAASIAFMTWAGLHYSRTQITVHKVKRREGDDGDD